MILRDLHLTVSDTDAPASGWVTTSHDITGAKWIVVQHAAPAVAYMSLDGNNWFQLFVGVKLHLQLDGIQRLFTRCAAPVVAPGLNTLVSISSAEIIIP